MKTKSQKKVLAKKSTKKASKKKSISQVELKNVRLTKASYDSLKKVKVPMWGNVVNAIESPVWLIPFDSYEYADIKEEMEKNAIPAMFEDNLPENAIIEIQSFDSNILSFHKGVYPDYSKKRK